MIELDIKYLNALRAVDNAADLRGVVQKAMELEFATIPPYLTAMMSLRPGTNRVPRSILRAVAMDEMLHMLITANLQVALGGRPLIASATIVPDYPGPLPMSVVTGLTVGLEACSLELVERTFMAIEQPEEPLVFPGVAAGFATIGTFYAALEAKIKELGDGAFTGDPTGQLIVEDFPQERLFPIVDVESAVRGIDVIVTEGEGTSQSPLAESGDVAHYYRFQQIIKGRMLVPEGVGGFSFTGAPTGFDAAGVLPITSNQKLSQLDADSDVGRQAHAFAVLFTDMLTALQRAFDDKSLDAYGEAVSAMFQMRASATALCAMPAQFGGQPTGLNAGPVFEYVD